MPVCIHVGAGDGVPAATERFDHPLYSHALAHPFEQMIAAPLRRLRRPARTLSQTEIRLHGSRLGWVPYWMERLDEHYEILQPTVPWLTKPPSEYMKSGQMFYAFEMEEKMLPYVADFVGAERLVFATDDNHSDSKFPHTVEEVMQRTHAPWIEGQDHGRERGEAVQLVAPQCAQLDYRIRPARANIILPQNHPSPRQGV